MEKYRDICVSTTLNKMSKSCWEKNVRYYTIFLVVYLKYHSRIIEEWRWNGDAQHVCWNSNWNPKIILIIMVAIFLLFLLFFLFLCSIFFFFYFYFYMFSNFNTISRWDTLNSILYIHNIFLYTKYVQTDILQ